MSKLVATLLATLVFAGVASAQPDAYQVHYFPNPGQAGTAVNITNNGANVGNVSDPTGTICANVYVFDANSPAELVACCACPIVAHGLAHLSGKGDLIDNTLTPAVPTSITVAIYATLDTGTCDATNPGLTSVSGLREWGTTLHALPTTPVTYAMTETEFSDGPLSTADLNNFSATCGFIKADGSSFGICGSCKPGAIGANKQM
ncbi:MAG TPA: hypothetical protein VG096_26155 [Bryobacteraceae bacterium]|jgi:hypothetical protein|nr:hypothetical protein [Bryobacteraceae bacterium]